MFKIIKKIKEVLGKTPPKSAVKKKKKNQNGETQKEK